jgi:hypothetical protein
MPPEGQNSDSVDTAVGGASVSFPMLVTARACQGVFAALLAPSALSLMATTFTDPKERGKAFGVYGAVAASGLGSRTADRRRADLPATWPATCTGGRHRCWSTSR